MARGPAPVRTRCERRGLRGRQNTDPVQVGTAQLVQAGGRELQLDTRRAANLAALASPRRTRTCATARLRRCHKAAQSVAFVLPPAAPARTRYWTCIPHCPDARRGLHVAYACGRRGQRFISLTWAFAPGKVGDVQLTGCSAGALTEPGAQRARKFAHAAARAVSEENQASHLTTPTTKRIRSVRAFAPTRASAVGTREEMARSMRRNGTAYWRALLMALWSLLNPTHPQ